MAADTQEITLTQIPLNDLVDYLERNNLEVVGGDALTWPPTIIVGVRHGPMPGEGRVLERPQFPCHRTRR
jgi:hypothetical protein